MIPQLAEFPARSWSMPKPVKWALGFALPKAGKVVAVNSKTDKVKAA
jgi:hypothetical protein